MRFEVCYYKTRQTAGVEALHVSNYLLLDHIDGRKGNAVTSLYARFGGQVVVQEKCTWGSQCFSSTQRTHCQLVTVLGRETKVSVRTMVAIPKSPAGIFPVITGKINPSSRTVLSVPISSIWECGIPKGGNKTTVEDGE